MFSSRQNAFIQQYYNTLSQRELADQLNLSQDEVRRRMTRMGLKPGSKKAETEPEGTPPRYTAEAALPTSFAPLSKPDFFTAGIVGICALLIYMLTLAPTVSGEDSGELVTAAYTLGVAHPPGYPLWCLLGKLFTYIPSGTIAGRVNFMSSFFSALAVFVVCLIIIKLTKNRLAGAAGALMMAFSAEFWEQSVIAEVYGLNSFLVVLAVFLLLLWYERRRPVTLLVFALVFGLGLCNHNTMMLLGPVFLSFVLYIDPKFMHRRNLYIACTVTATACLGIYAYLPIRSLADPPVDWGNPETWEAMLAHITREQYAFAMKENPRTIGRLAAQLWAFAKLYVWEFGPWLAWLPLLGVVVLWKREKVILAFLGAIGVVTSLGVMWVTNFDIDRQSLWLNNVFWIPCYIVAAIGAGLALGWIAQQRWIQIRAKRVAWGLAIAMVGGPLALNYWRNDKSDYYFASDFGKNTLLSLEENAIYFPSADHATFPVIYFQACEGMRPDVTMANKYGYPEESLYADMPENIRSTFGTIPNAAQEKVIEKWIIEQNPDRPVYFTQKRDMRDLPDYEIKEHGIVFALRKTGTEVEPLDWEQYRWHILDPEKTRDELTADSILADAYYMRGRALLQVDKQADGLEAFQIAARLGPESKETMNNLGSACAEFGLQQEAIRYYKQCVEAAPDYAMARKNLAQVYLTQDDIKNALLQFEEYLKEAPDEPQALRSSAECMARIGWHRDAITRLEYLAKVTPGDASVYRLMGQYYEEGKISMNQANAHYTKSLELDPTQQDLLAKLNPTAQGPELPGLPGQAPGAGLPEIPGLDLPTIPSLPQIPTPGSPSGLPGAASSVPQLPGGF